MRERKMGMPRLLTSSTVWGVTFLWSLIVPALLYIPRQALYEILNAIVFSVATGVVVGYRSGFAAAISRPMGKLRAGEALQIGVVIGWAATAVVFGVLWYWRLTGKNDDIIDGALNAASRWVLISSGMMHLAASGSINGLVPLRSYLRSGTFVAIGLFFGALVIMFADIPETRPIIYGP